MNGYDEPARAHHASDGDGRIDATRNQSDAGWCAGHVPPCRFTPIMGWVGRKEVTVEMTVEVKEGTEQSLTHRDRIGLPGKRRMIERRIEEDETPETLAIKGRVFN